MPNCEVFVYPLLCFDRKSLPAQLLDQKNGLALLRWPIRWGLGLSLELDVCHCGYVRLL
jgi:hypothetical protein